MSTERNGKQRACPQCGGLIFNIMSRQGVEVELSTLRPHQMVSAGYAPGTHLLWTCAACDKAESDGSQQKQKPWGFSGFLEVLPDKSQQVAVSGISAERLASLVKSMEEELDFYRIHCDEDDIDDATSWLSALRELQSLRTELEQARGRSRHTQEWYSQHYGKLQDWARKILPEEWRTQFFNCVANGLYDPIRDVGVPYKAVAGFMVTPGGYFQMPTAQEQILFDQCVRAETAEAELEQRNRMLDELTEKADSRLRELEQLKASHAVLEKALSDATNDSLGKEIVKRMRGLYVTLGLGEWVEWGAALDQMAAAVRAQKHLAETASQRYERIMELERAALEAARKEGQ